jgi:OPA family glycerol-3-phosphate transporter-like MFS transporter
MSNFFKSVGGVIGVDTKNVDKEYTRYKWQVFITIFLGYAVFYITRKNLSFAKPYLIQQLGYTKLQVGAIAAGMPLAYGFGKFIMGGVSDKLNPRYFMGFGLILAGIVNIMFGSVDSIIAFTVLWTLNGWVQSMGWPPCGKTMKVWFSDDERGTWMSVWNTAHNVGAMLIPFVVIMGVSMFSGSWRGLFFLPGIISIIAGILTMIFLRDKPESLGLPSVREYHGEIAKEDIKVISKRTSRQIFVEDILRNKVLWSLALSNAFIYFLRYGTLDWISVYLVQYKGLNIKEAGFSFFMFEFAAIPGTILLGWISDKVFKGRRTPLIMICLVLAALLVATYWMTDNMIIINIAISFIGALIYFPVAAIGIAAVDIAKDDSAGMSAGWTGLFGYFIGATGSELGVGYVLDNYSWNVYFMMLIASAIIAILLLIPAWNSGKEKTIIA